MPQRKNGGNKGQISNKKTKKIEGVEERGGGGQKERKKKTTMCNRSCSPTIVKKEKGWQLRTAPEAGGKKEHTRWISSQPSSRSLSYFGSLKQMPVLYTGLGLNTPQEMDDFLKKGVGGMWEAESKQHLSLLEWWREGGGGE